MKTVFECSFGVEAHVISGLLRSVGIDNQVLGEYLQGGAGDLPVGRLVRVVVADEKAEAARATIAEWESAVPDTTDLEQESLLNPAPGFRS